MAAKRRLIAPPVPRGSGRRWGRALAWFAAAATWAPAPQAAARPQASARRVAQPEPAARPQARVLAEESPVYSGPGFGFRTLAVVHRDDVLRMVERGKRGGWTRVELPSGITGWILTEQILIFGDTADPGQRPGPFRRFGRTLRDKVLGPPNLMTARMSGTLSAGALGDEGLFLVRPGVFLSPNVSFEAYLGPSAGREVNRGIFGLGVNLFVSPAIPFSVFVSVGTGAVYTRGKVDTIQDATWSYLLSPGGGFWIIFKHNIGVRFDMRNHILFRADSARSLQEYSGALAFTF